VPGTARCVLPIIPKLFSRIKKFGVYAVNNAARDFPIRCPAGVLPMQAFFPCRKIPLYRLHVGQTAGAWHHMGQLKIDFRDASPWEFPFF